MIYRCVIRHGILSLFLLITLGLNGCALPLTLPRKGSTLAGDVDGNGRVDIWDARSLDRSLASTHFRVPYPANGDVSQNGELDRGDFEAIEKRAHGCSTLEITVNRDNKAPVIIGGISSIVVADTFRPLDVKEGSVRITSQASNYDSGECKVYHVADGRSLVYHWNTTGLLPADDFVIDVQLKKGKGAAEPVSANEKSSATARTSSPEVSESTAQSDERYSEVTETTLFVASSAQNVESAVTVPQELPAVEEPEPMRQFEVANHRVQMSLIARARELPLLEQAIDLSLPFWGMNLGISRGYRYSATTEPEITEFGRGWTHLFGLRLVEHTDGMIEILGAGPSAPKFEKSDDGLYQAVAGGMDKLVRDPDGSFQLSVDNECFWKFDVSLKPVEICDQQNHRITLGYDNDHLVRIADQAQQLLALEYDGDLVTNVTDSVGRIVRYQYDDDQNLVSVTKPSGEQSSYEYDEEHRLTRVSHDGVVRRVIAYRDDRLVRSIEGDESIQLDYRLNTIGLGIRSIHSSAGRVLQEEITPDGRVAARRFGMDGEPILFEYDDKFTICKVTGASQASWASTPNDAGKRTCLTLPTGAEMTWRQVPEQHATVVTDANGIKTILRYLESGQLTHIQYADGLVEVRRYLESKEGKSVLCELRSGQTVQYWFDQRGLLQAVQINRQPKNVYQYDVLGNLTRGINDWGTMAFEYDNRSRLVACTYPNGREIRYQYDLMGRRTSMTGPANNRLVYRYDDEGRLTSIGQADEPELAEYRYEQGHLTSRKTSNKVIYNFEYTTEGKVKSIQSEGADKQSRGAWTYSYDALGRKISESHNGQSQSYEYDSLGHLSLTGNGGNLDQSLQYDPMGNRVAVNAMRFAPNVLNQYSSIGNEIRTYDLNGNLNSRMQAGQKTAFEHDALNRLLRVRLPNQVLVSYQYDPLGRLATRDVNGKTTRYYWDGDRLVYSETDRGACPQTYVWGEKTGELVAIHREGKWYFCSQDDRGSVTEVTDDQGQIVASVQYDCFGNVTAEDKGIFECPFRFAGEFYDPLTKLVRMPHRWYEPKSGAYLEPHGLSAISGEHPYTYAGSDPVNRRSCCEKGMTTPRDFAAVALQEKCIGSSNRLPSIAVLRLHDLPSDGANPSQGLAALMSQLIGLPSLR